MRYRTWLALAVSSSMLAVAACSGDSAGVGSDADAGGGGGTDAGATDSGSTSKDSGGTPTDSGTPTKDSGPTVDAGAVDFVCQSTPLPTTAPATVTLSGGVVDQGLGGQTAIDGATINAYATQTSTTSVANTTSDSSGDFSFDLSTGGTPVDGYLKITKAGELDTYLYPNFPLSSDQSKLAGVMVTSTSFTGLAFLEGVTQDAAKGFTAVEVLDCSGVSVTGATVTTSAGGTAKYDGATGPDKTATATGADGIAYVFNMTPGDATIMVSIGSKAYRTHHIVTRTGVFTITLATP